mmetsp:Transcript_13380/g.33497  ORF Transcript_13380/g.33497 Transcript_13380/m.33497 type:complete len:203 (+) Transcript_13380:270-878(+)
MMTTDGRPPAEMTAIAGIRGMIDGISRIAATGGTRAGMMTATAARPPAEMMTAGMIAGIAGVGTGMTTGTAGVAVAGTIVGAVATATTTAAVAGAGTGTIAAAAVATTAGAEEDFVTKSPGGATCLPSRLWTKTMVLLGGLLWLPTPAVVMPDLAARMPGALRQDLAGIWGTSLTTLLWHGQTGMAGEPSCRVLKRRCFLRA